MFELVLGVKEETLSALIMFELALLFSVSEVMTNTKDLECTLREYSPPRMIYSISKMM